MLNSPIKTGIWKKSFRGDYIVKVLKFGGSSLKNSNGFKKVADIIKNQNEEVVIILSGIYRVTDTIQKYLDVGRYGDEEINLLIEKLRNLHFKVIKKTISDKFLLQDGKEKINEKLERLKRLLKGVYFVEELTDKTKDLIVSFGERLSIIILEKILIDNNIKSRAFEADKIGIVTNGDHGKACALLDQVSNNIRKNIVPVLKSGTVPIITGFFGCDLQGNTTSFGRNGSDYSASVVAYAIDANNVEIWKDVNGFLTSDPSIIKNSKVIYNLSYAEAAELSYFGAKILHPRTVEPLAKKRIKLQIKNTFNPNFSGSVISKVKTVDDNIVKSVAFTKNIACIKIFGPAIGCKPGVLSDIASKISLSKINIISVITSQTCITILLKREDLNRAYKLISSNQIKTVEGIKKIKNIALIGLVGEGIIDHYGIAAKAFGAISKKGINIEMISAGSSDVAYYFIVDQKYLNSTVELLHDEFFDTLNQ